jgi:hypothetical protein
MKIIKVLGDKKCYQLKNGDLVPFWEYGKYLQDRGFEPITEKPVKKKRTKKKVKQ